MAMAMLTRRQRSDGILGPDKEDFDLPQERMKSNPCFSSDVWWDGQHFRRPTQEQPWATKSRQGDCLPVLSWETSRSSTVLYNAR